MQIFWSWYQLESMQQVQITRWTWNGWLAKRLDEHTYWGEAKIINWNKDPDFKGFVVWTWELLKPLEVNNDSKKSRWTLKDYHKH